MGESRKDWAITGLVVAVLAVAAALVVCLQRAPCGSSEPQLGARPRADVYRAARAERAAAGPSAPPALHHFRLGGGRFVEVADFGRLVSGAEASALLWVRLPAGGECCLVEKYGHDEPRLPGLTRDMRPGRPVLRLADDGARLGLQVFHRGVAAQELAVPTPLRDGAWHLVGFSLGKGAVALYVDGAEVAAERAVVPLDTEVHPQALAVGRTDMPEVFVSNFVYLNEALGRVAMAAFFGGGRPVDPAGMGVDVALYLPFGPDDQLVDGALSGAVRTERATAPSRPPKSRFVTMEK